MKSIVKKLSALSLILLGSFIFAQSSSMQTFTAKVKGNCGMCEQKIEGAVPDKKTATVDWNQDTKMATVHYDPSKISKSEILKKIAQSGYDNEEFSAPDNVYASLPSCCQYDRDKTDKAVNTAVKTEPQHQNHHATANEKAAQSTGLNAVFGAYFLVKDAFVASDRKLASAHAKKMLQHINTVDMSKLSKQSHDVWMKVLPALKSDTGHIATMYDLEHQREHLIQLSENMALLMKSSKLDQPVYILHCPMANDGKGADWISTEAVIKNPYYGAKMLSCGSVKEEIK